MLGVAARGDQAAGPLDRRTGEGWVAKSTDHDYADAQRRGNGVTLFVTETTGALASGFVDCLRAMDKQSRLPTTHDSTCYGESSSSPRTFYTHHLAAISAAIVQHDAEIAANAAASLNFHMSVGLGA